MPKKDASITDAAEPVLLDYPTKDAFAKRNDWKYIIRIFQILTITGIVLFVFVGLTCAFLGETIMYGPKRTPSEYFQRASGMLLPADAEIVYSREDHRSMNGDGYFVCIFDLNDEGINRLLEQRIWGQDWAVGQPLDIIRRHCCDDRFQNEPIWERDDVHHLAQNMSPNNDILPWHNGRIFIIDSEAGRVWFGDWDF